MAECGAHVGQPEYDLFDRLLQDERSIREHMEQQQALFEQQRFEHELALYEEDLQAQKEHDLQSLESLDASYAQSSDDWTLWKAMNDPPSPKRRRLVLHVHLPSDSTARVKSWM